MALGKNKIEKEKDMKVILIGAGNLATHLGKAIFAAGHDVVQVFSRTMQSATALASEVGAQPVSDISDVRSDADLYVVSVKAMNLQPSLVMSTSSSMRIPPKSL